MQSSRAFRERAPEVRLRYMVPPSSRRIARHPGGASGGSAARGVADGWVAIGERTGAERTLGREVGRRDWSLLSDALPERSRKLHEVAEANAPRIE